MIKDLRIIFMGTPDFAVGTLKALIENNFNIAGVVTAPDKPAGRGRKLNSSAVKKYAIEQGLPVLQPSSLKAPEFIEALKALQGNLQIVVAFRMLPMVVWDLPEYGTFNLHASLLPQYRGAAPIHWAIINGETQTGVTTFFIDDKSGVPYNQCLKTKSPSKKNNMQFKENYVITNGKFGNFGANLKFNISCLYMLLK